MSEESTGEKQPDVIEKTYTKNELQEALSAIARKVVESHAAYMHSMLLLNQLLRLPNAEQIFDEDLKQQAKDLWLKVKSSGLQLTDPPMLFGYPTTNGGEKAAS